MLTGAKRWLPLIALYSGCRIEEGAGLRVVDIKKTEGVLCFDFVPHGRRGLKAASSRRRVPVHGSLCHGNGAQGGPPPQEGVMLPIRR